MPAYLHVAYPQGADVDLAYYQETHMRLAWEAWRPLLRGYEITVATDDKAPFEVQLLVQFDSLEDIGKTMAATSAETAQKLKDDIPNFAKKVPVMWTSVVKGTNPATPP